METHLKEKIKVGVIYGGKKKIMPVWFMWKGTKYPVKEITYYWQDSKGREPLHYFSVSDGDTLFKLCFNGYTLDWRLLGAYL
ncbi:MAG: hypothetical protein SWO11_10710 [Thermodesulfobacteriota bacterium]|nr:hypothetical protein [Thermodesulfobacteriota bacterium]